MLSESNAGKLESGVELSICEGKDIKLLSGYEKRNASSCGLGSIVNVPTCDGNSRGDSLRVTAEVFDSYDNTFAYDAAGKYLNRLAHEKGGQLWLDSCGVKKVLVGNSFVMKVKAGESISFSVKLDGSHLGDKGSVLDFGKESDWWEVCEWRVNGNVKRTNDTTFNLTLTKGNNVHVGVRLQRKQFAVKVMYHGASDDNYIQDDGSKGPGEPFSSGTPLYVYPRKNGATPPVL